MTQAQPGNPQRPPPKQTRWWVWVLAVLGVLVLCCGILANHNQNDCVEEGLCRVGACSGFVCEGMVKVFTSSCLK
jgi:hypothetical protein